LIFSLPLGLLLNFHICVCFFHGSYSFVDSRCCSFALFRIPQDLGCCL
jgi:hypothetical protein